jgi:hypothetical protein
MMTRKTWFGLVMAAAIGTVGVAQALCQDAGGPPARPRFDPAEMRKAMEERMKTNLGVTDDEWKVLQPKIEAVTKIRQETMMGGMRGMFGRGPRPGQPGGPGGDRPAGEAPKPAADQPPQSEMAKASDALGKVLENKEAKPEEIKTALQALRDARVATKAKLEKAQKELKEIVTVKQEAQLVMMGMLE